MISFIIFWLYCGSVISLLMIMRDWQISTKKYYILYPNKSFKTYFNLNKHFILPISIIQTFSGPFVIIVWIFCEIFIWNSK